MTRWNSSWLKCAHFYYGATWTAAAIGCEQVRVVRWALQLGGHLRTGLENNTCLDNARLAQSNAALMRQIADLAGDDFSRPVAAAHKEDEVLG